MITEDASRMTFSDLQGRAWKVCICDCALRQKIYIHGEIAYKSNDDMCATSVTISPPIS